MINVADVYRENFQIEPTSLDRVQATPEEIGTYHVQPGDVFFVRSSLKLEGTGRSAVVINCEPDSVFECHLVQGRPNTLRVNPRFLAFQLNSFGLRHYLISRANVVTMATIAQDVIASCPVWLPALPGQSAIVRFIDGATADLDRVIGAAHRELTLLREYRTRLIADLVTGKLDVRGAAARLPDEAEEPEQLNEADTLPDTGEGPVEDFDAAPEEVEA